MIHWRHLNAAVDAITHVCWYVENSVLTSGVGGRGRKHTPKSFYLLKIWAKSLKIWAKMAPNLVWFHKMQKNTWRPFFIPRSSLKREVIPKKGLHDLWGKKFVGKVAQNFSGKFGIRAKIFRTPKNLPAPTPVVLTMQLPQHSTCKSKHHFTYTSVPDPRERKQLHETEYKITHLKAKWFQPRIPSWHRDK